MSSPSFLSTTTSTSQIYTLSLHDALPISAALRHQIELHELVDADEGLEATFLKLVNGQHTAQPVPTAAVPTGNPERSEEHTSELQSRGHLVCRLLLEKKNKRQTIKYNK